MGFVGIHFMFKICGIRRVMNGIELIPKIFGVTDAVVDALSHFKFCLGNVTERGSSESHFMLQGVTCRSIDDIELIIKMWRGD